MGVSCARQRRYDDDMLSVQVPEIRVYYIVPVLWRIMKLQSTLVISK